MGSGESRPGGSGLSGWRVERFRGLSTIVCVALRAVSGVGHAFSTRIGPGGVDFDLGAHDASAAPYPGRRRLLCDAAGLPGQYPVLMEQVHEARVVDGHQAAGPGPLRADAIVVLRGDAPGVAAAVRTADCVPILLADSRGRAVAAVHAGWRGTAAGIATRTVAALAERGIAGKALVAAIGPAIGPGCYEVGREVAEAVARGTGVGPEAISGLRGGRRTLDLALANRVQLERAGVPAEAIHRAPWCSACRRDLFFSHRGDDGPTGRLMACIGWASHGQTTP